LRLPRHLQCSRHVVNLVQNGSPHVVNFDCACEIYAAENIA
jgi:hypothetical protein